MTLGQWNVVIDLYKSSRVLLRHNTLTNCLDPINSFRMVVLLMKPSLDTIIIPGDSCRLPVSGSKEDYHEHEISLLKKLFVRFIFHIAWLGLQTPLPWNSTSRYREPGVLPVSNATPLLTSDAARRVGG